METPLRIPRLGIQRQRLNQGSRHSRQSPMYETADAVDLRPTGSTRSRTRTSLKVRAALADAKVQRGPRDAAEAQVK